MLKNYIAVILFVTLAAPTLPLRKTILQDRIKGAMLGCAMGDALGRASSLCATVAEAQSTYGSRGVTTFSHFRPRDWLRNSENYKIAARTQNSILAFLVLNSLIAGRLHNVSEETMLESIAQKISTLLGVNHLMIDPLFDQRQYTPKIFQISQMITHNLQKSGQSRWPIKETLTDAGDSLSMNESDSTGLIRAWPYGLVFFEEVNVIKTYVINQMLISHRHPSALSAGVALAVGISAAIRGHSIDEIISEMIHAAEEFDEDEKIYKPFASKLSFLISPVAL